MQGKYEKRALLGKGATAQVYLVEEVNNGNCYALKEFYSESIFRQEKEVWEILKQRDVKEKLYFPEFIECMEEECALVMEYVAGKDLQTMLEEGHDFLVVEIVGIMEEVLDALQELHSLRLIYRDLKPANIMLGKDGRVRLIDMGTACLVGENVVRERKDRNVLSTAEEMADSRDVVIKAGTYGYAAPEQFWDGVRPDITCDIYSAGKVLAYLLTGKNPALPPYDIEQYCKGMKNVPGEFLRIINRSLAEEPQARFADCESMKRSIRKAYDECRRWKIYRRRGKTTITYKKCIWLSEYRRIF